MLRRWPARRTALLLICAAVFISYIDRTNIAVAAVAMRRMFGWSETQKGLVLSAFYVGYIALMLPSAGLANRFGGRVVLGAAVAWWSIFTVLTPIAAFGALPLLVAARIALGLGEAAVFPASINLIGSSMPPSQRSRAVALLISSLHIGTLFALPATGWLVQTYGWPIPFYAFGAVGLLWTAVWFAWMRPEARAEPSTAGAREPIPWGTLLRLPAVWAIVAGHFSSNWMLYVTSAWLPTYLSSTFGVSVGNAGLLSAAPSLCSFAAANAAGFAADRLLSRGCSATWVRKLMQTSGLGAGAVFLLLLTGAESIAMALVFLCCAAGSVSLTTAGFAPNGLDIAPRYADVIYGISNTFATLPGIAGVFLTGWMVDRTGSFVAPFFVTAGVALVGAAIFLVFASGKRQID